MHLFPNYSVVFDFELNFDKDSHHRWMMANWHFVYYYIGFYLLIIFGGQAYMNSRPKGYSISRVLAAWNLSLAVFSIFGAFRTVPELMHTLKYFGLHHTVCNPSYLDDTVSGFWSRIFVLSKVPELGDTIFIVLRKQNLIFLHWYHHITVLLYCWYVYQHRIAFARWFVTMNYTVHSVMYTYYALRAFKIHVPKVVSMLITTLQIMQMVVGCFVCIYAYLAKANGDSCSVTETVVIVTLMMYSSYLILFARFFFVSYFKCGVKSSSKVTLENRIKTE